MLKLNTNIFIIEIIIFWTYSDLSFPFSKFKLKQNFTHANIIKISVQNYLPENQNIACVQESFMSTFALYYSIFYIRHSSRITKNIILT